MISTTTRIFTLLRTIILFCAIYAVIYFGINNYDSSFSIDNEFLDSNRNLLQTTTVKFDDFYEIAKGNGYHIFRVKSEFNNSRGLISPPERWISSFIDVYGELDVTVKSDDRRSKLIRARAAYSQVLLGFVTARSFGNAERSVIPFLQKKVLASKPFDANLRRDGQDWTYLGTTMTGIDRIVNVETLLIEVFNNNIPGGYVETGVWRGGSSIFARGVIRAYKQGSRQSYVCDSFAGLPPGDPSLHPKEAGWDNTPYLSVNEILVMKNFRKMSLLDTNVVFVKGFFNNSMPALAKIVTEIAILRIDGDMYQSTVDVLYHLYDKIAINGYVIIDDWESKTRKPKNQFVIEDYPAKTACEDFFKAHKMSPVIVPIDVSSVYWKKTEQITIQYWRYKAATYT